MRYIARDQLSPIPFPKNVEILDEGAFMGYLEPCSRDKFPTV